MIIRSSKHYFNDCNKGKVSLIEAFIANYTLMVQKYVNVLWSDFRNNKVAMLESDACNKILTKTETDSRIRQCAAKQACSIVNATLEKSRKQLWMLRKLQKEGKKSTRFLQRKMDCFRPSKPILKSVNPVLDSRFVTFEHTLGGHFDMFVGLEQLGDGLEFNIPINVTRMSEKWLKAGGELKGSVTLSDKYVTLHYDVPEPEKKKTGKTVGADQGLVTCLTLSDGQATQKDRHGHDLNSICEKLARRKKGSKGFEQAQAHRKNYVNWSINRINFRGIRQVNLERLVNVRKGKKSKGRRMSHWTYADIRTKLVRLSETEGFRLVEQDNKFRSQRCSLCGWVHKSNRKGKTLRCQSAICRNTADADLNAASNHETELCDLTNSRVWYEHLNRTSGFYWTRNGVYDRDGEPIVPHAQKE
jgi:transposase